LRNRGFHISWKVLEFLFDISWTWKILENDLGPGKFWSLLGYDVDGSFWLQVDTFLQTKIAIIVATRYVCRYAKNAFAAGLYAILWYIYFLSTQVCISLPVLHY